MYQTTMLAAFFTLLTLTQTQAISPLRGTKSPCEISTRKRNHLLSLSYGKFDQTKNRGFRKYAMRGCFSEMGLLLDQYFYVHVLDLEEWQKRVLIWHAGQMYALANDVPEALKRFKSTFLPYGMEDPLLNWDDYVAATIAFLEKDFERLSHHRNQLAMSKQTEGNLVNLKVVDSFIKNFRKTYLEAYSTK